MRIENMEIKDVKKIVLSPFFDVRGSFTKFYNEELYREADIEFELKEQYMSVSNKGVIRGMHFQRPPFECDKLVTVLKGSVLDVVLDLRRSSPTYLQWIDVVLKEKEPKALFIPKGCAHGFFAMEDNSCMLYNVSTLYKAEYDTGIRWDSFGYDWKASNPIISVKDQGLPALEQFQTPF